MFYSRKMLMRLAVIAAIVIAAWTAWRRVDAVIDKWNDFYHTALGVHIIRGFFEADSTSQAFDREWEAFDQEFHDDASAPPRPRQAQRTPPASSLDDLARASDGDFDRRFDDQWWAFDENFLTARRRMQAQVPTRRSPSSQAARPAAPVEPPVDDPAYKRYEERSLVKPVPVPPTPYVAEEYTKGYYVGLWNFLWHARVIPMVGSIMGTLFWIWWWRRRQRLAREEEAKRRLAEELDEDFDDLA